MIDAFDGRSPAGFASASGIAEPPAVQGRSGPAGAPTTSPLRGLAEWLPRLGSVLWLERCGAHGPAVEVEGPARGIVLGGRALQALAACTTVHAHASVTSQGPREWLSFHDARGEVCAKLFLLPDTDCLAWDEMTAAMAIDPGAEAWPPLRPHWAFLRAAWARFGLSWRARVLRFQCGGLAWLPTLDACPPLQLSLIGMEAARAIARGEGAELAAPLHAV